MPGEPPTTSATFAPTPQDGTTDKRPEVCDEAPGFCSTRSMDSGAHNYITDLMELAVDRSRWVVGEAPAEVPCKPSSQSAVPGTSTISFLFGNAMTCPRCAAQRHFSHGYEER